MWFIDTLLFNQDPLARVCSRFTGYIRITCQHSNHGFLKIPDVHKYATGLF